MHSDSELRILSLLASATEIVCALGFGSRIVGRSHECDFPPEIRALPQVTSPRFAVTGSSRSIDDRIKSLVREADSLDALGVYRVSTGRLQELRPTHIVTQVQCEVCAVSQRDVERAVAQVSGLEPVIVSLQPDSLEDVYQGFVDVAAALGDKDAGTHLAQRVRASMQAVADGLPTGRGEPRVAVIEWMDPLMAAGNWTPELVEMAGGRNLLGRGGEHSEQISFESLHKADPDVIVVSPCGFDIARTLQERSVLEARSGWQSLRAVQTGSVFVADGNQYFNRPGPRVVETLQILAEILHSGKIDYGRFGSGWVRWADGGLPGRIPPDAGPSGVSGL